MRILLLVFIVGILFGCQSKSKSGSTDRVEHPITQPAVPANPYIIKCDYFVNLFDSTQVLEEKTVVSLNFEEDELKFSAWIEEDNILYKFTQRDTCIWRDPCIEFFLDPLADGIDYYEMEFNAGGHLWDLKLKTSQPPINSPSNMVPWDIADTYNVKIDGTANDSRDQDNNWILSGRIRWEQILEGRPKKGDKWAYNFLRVNYDKAGRATYWVAQSTGEANIHFPANWPVHTF